MTFITLALSSSFSIVALGAAGLAGIFIGLIYKVSLVAKNKKKILRLEDEMLANHSRILKLEEANTKLQTELQAYRNAANEGRSKVS